MRANIKTFNEALGEELGSRINDFLEDMKNSKDAPTSVLVFVETGKLCGVSQFVNRNKGDHSPYRYIGALRILLNDSYEIDLDRRDNIASAVDRIEGMLEVCAKVATIADAKAIGNMLDADGLLKSLKRYVSGECKDALPKDVAKRILAGVDDTCD